MQNKHFLNAIFYSAGLLISINANALGNVGCFEKEGFVPVNKKSYIFKNNCDTNTNLLVGDGVSRMGYLFFVGSHENGLPNGRVRVFTGEPTAGNLKRLSSPQEVPYFACDLDFEQGRIKPTNEFKCSLNAMTSRNGETKNQVLTVSVNDSNIKFDNIKGIITVDRPIVNGSLWFGKSRFELKGEADRFSLGESRSFADRSLVKIDGMHGSLSLIEKEAFNRPEPKDIVKVEGVLNLSCASDYHNCSSSYEGLNGAEIQGKVGKQYLTKIVHRSGLSVDVVHAGGNRAGYIKTVDGLEFDGFIEECNYSGKALYRLEIIKRNNNVPKYIILSPDCGKLTLPDGRIFKGKLKQMGIE